MVRRQSNRRPAVRNERPSYYIFRGSANPGPTPNAEREIVRVLLDGFRVVEISEFKELVVNAHLIRAREHNGSATLRAVLDEFGQLHSIRLEREIVMGGASGTKTYSREYSRVGSTTLREPEWVDRAINRRKRPERRMSGHR